MKAHERLFDPRPGLYDPSRSERSRGQHELHLLDIARCPLCRVPLVARLGRHGPCFPCRCKRNGAAGQG